MRLPLVIYNHHHTCETLYDDRSLEYAECNAAEFLERLSLENGSSLQGRINAFRYLTHTSQKSAVMISEITQDLYFPTVSMQDPECIWIHYNEIVDISGKTNQTNILFTKGISVDIPVSFRTIKLQMKRCQEYLALLHELKSQYR